MSSHFQSLGDLNNVVSRRKQTLWDTDVGGFQKDF